MLADFPGEYEELKSLIQTGKVAKIEKFFNSLIEGGHYSVGPSTFSPFGISPPSPLPPSNPRKTYTNTGLPELSRLRFTMQSLVMIACHHPYQTTGVIKYLCCNFPNYLSLNQLEWCYHQLHSWSCVAPLHVACTGYNQNLKLVKVLVKLGADVNLKSGCCKVTPLHLAVASYGREQAIDIARFLIDHGALVDAVDRNGDTPLTLVLRCYGGSQLERIVDLLVSRKANINHSNNLGCTALHYAALNNDVDIVTLLLSLGASPMYELSQDPSSSLPCPLYLTTVEEVADVFMSSPNCPIPCKVDSLLLMGATLADYANTYEMWKNAVTLRERHGLVTPGEITIDGMKEMGSIAELEQIYHKIVEADFLPNFMPANIAKGLAIQTLLIKERCLRYMYPCSLSDLAEIVKDSQQYTDNVAVGMGCLKLISRCFQNSLLPHWSLGVERHWISRISALSEILNLIESRMSTFHNDCKLTFAQMQTYAENCVGILGALNCSYKYALCTKRSSMHFETRNVIWILLSVLVNCLSWSEKNEGAYVSFKLIVQDLVDKHLYLMNTTLLHLIPKYFSYDCAKDLVHFYELVLQSEGAESAVNYVSSEGNRPVHCIAENVSDPQHVLLILSLCETGAHFDAVNKKGKTVIDYLEKANMKSLLEQHISPSPLPLACLASRTILKENIPYLQMDSVPPRIKNYVAIHDPGCCVYSSP